MPFYGGGAILYAHVWCACVLCFAWQCLGLFVSCMGLCLRVSLWWCAYVLRRVSMFSESNQWQTQKQSVNHFPPPSPCHPCWPSLPCILCSGRGRGRDHARHPPSPCHPCWPSLPCILCSGRGRDHARHSPVIMVMHGGAVQRPCLLQERRTTLRLSGGRSGWGCKEGRQWQLGHRPRLVGHGGDGVSLLQRKGRAEIGCHLELGVTMVTVPMSNGHHGDRS